MFFGMSIFQILISFERETEERLRYKVNMKDKKGVTTLFTNISF